MEIYRQGDILLKKLNEKPDLKGLKKVNKVEVVLGYGEVTGHKHQINEKADLYASSEQEAEFFAINGGDVPIYVNVSSPTNLIHEEHGKIDLDEGWYEIIRQREYAPERIKYVQD